MSPDLLIIAGSTRQSFFINYLYLALRELNAIPEFKMRVHDGRPYIYGKVDCSFTVANEYGYFVNRTAETATTRYSMRLWLKQSERQRKRRIYIQRLLFFAALI